MNLLQKIQKLCRKNNISIKQLSKESKISYNTLVTLGRKQKTHNPKIVTVQKIAEYFKISVEELIEGVDFKE